MSNEEKILQILGAMQQDIGSMKQDVQQLSARVDDLDRKLDQTTQALDKKLDQTTQALDKKLDQTTQALDRKIDQIKQDFDEKLDQTKREMITLFDAEFTPKFNLLSESVDMILDRLPPEGFMESVNDRLDILEAVTRKHSHEIAALKRAN